MKRVPWKVLAPLGLVLLAACSAGSDEATDVAAAEDATESATPNVSQVGTGAAGLGDRPDLPVSLPKMAYVFDYGFRLAAADIAPLQQEHADMCEALGPYQCQIVSLTRTGEEDDVVGELQLAVASDKARGFAGQLAAAAESDGAEFFRADIRGEDLSKSIVDTEARLRTRIALRDRLLEVLRTRKGSVQELVDAERGVAQVNEEIDQAQSWLAEQKGRVAFSRMTLTYESANPGGSFLAPIRGAAGSLGTILGNLVAVAIVLGAIGLPVLAAVFGARRLRRRFGWTPASEA